MISFKKKCPNCGEGLTIWVDLSEGPPKEAGEECENCGAIPVWRVQWTYDVWLEQFLHDERQLTQGTLANDIDDLPILDIDEFYAGGTV